MALRSLSLLVLVGVALRESCLGASSHSLKYFSTSISEPSQGQPHFVFLGCVDGQVFVHYDSNSQRMQPRVSWMEKVGKEDPQYWDRETQIQRENEEPFRKNLEVLRLLYNQNEVNPIFIKSVGEATKFITGYPGYVPACEKSLCVKSAWGCMQRDIVYNHARAGLHTWQEMYGCELLGDGSKGGFIQFGYDGRTFLTFDKERLTWVAPDPQAQIIQRKWDTIPGYNQREKAYLEEECIEWLEKLLSYGKETLLRTEPPEVTVSSKTEVEDGMETHVCRLYGFYPREIDASWRRDGEVWLQDTLHGSLAPNADGTFHAWLSIQIDPKERGHYRCHVEHDGLQEPLDVALEEPKSNLGLIIGCIVAVTIGCIVLLCAIVGIFVFLKRRQNDYKKAPTTERGFSSSSQGRNQTA